MYDGQGITRTQMPFMKTVTSCHSSFILSSLSRRLASLFTLIPISIFRHLTICKVVSLPELWVLRVSPISDLFTVAPSHAPDQLCCSPVTTGGDSVRKSLQWRLLFSERNQMEWYGSVLVTELFSGQNGSQEITVLRTKWFSRQIGSQDRTFVRTEQVSWHMSSKDKAVLRTKRFSGENSSQEIIVMRTERTWGQNGSEVRRVLRSDPFSGQNGFLDSVVFRTKEFSGQSGSQDKMVLRTLWF